MRTEGSSGANHIEPDGTWSIGIYGGASLFQLTAAHGHANPVITGESVSDVPAKFVADPFMIRSNGIWNMFFEVLNQQTDKGEIGLALSRNGVDWKYQEIILSEQFHLSYPSVFEWDGDYYMIPETLSAKEVRLYKAHDFPRGWAYVGTLVAGDCADPSIFRFDDRWWMFACSTPYQHDTLRLYFAEDLTGPWGEHPASPIVEGNKGKARPAGKVLVLDDGIIRFAQECTAQYGTRVRAFEIFDLTTESYVEREHPNSPILSATGGRCWNALRMHHIDAHQLSDGQWIACVDGYGDKG